MTVMLHLPNLFTGHWPSLPLFVLYHMWPFLRIYKVCAIKRRDGCECADDTTQPDFRWVFRRVDKSFRGASEAQIECSECHFPMGRPLGDGSFPWINLTDAWNFRLLLSIGSWLTTYRLRHRAVETSFLGKKFVIHKSAISSPRHPSEIYSEQDESEIRTCVLTITKLRSTCWSKYILIF